MRPPIMTAPKLAATRPAALTGRVGQGGDNRIHDVTLVQALLGAKRDKSSRPYLRKHAPGKYDKVTAEALMRFRMNQRDGNMRQPLARSGPTLNKLAEGQSLAVLEGTNIAYKLATLAVPGEATRQGPGEVYRGERQAQDREQTSLVPRNCCPTRQGRLIEVKKIAAGTA